MGLIVRTRFGLSRRMPVGIGEGGRAGLLWLQTVLLLEDQVLWTTPFFVHEGPIRAAKNTLFVHEGPRRANKGREEHPFCPRRATKGQ